MANDMVVEKVRVAAARYMHLSYRVRATYMIGALIAILSSETGADRGELMLAIEETWKNAAGASSLPRVIRGLG